MTLLGGAVYAGFFALAALWLVATNPDTESERAQADSLPRENANSADSTRGQQGSVSCCAGQSSQ